MPEPRQARSFYTLGTIGPGTGDARLNIRGSVGIDRDEYEKIQESINAINRVSPPFHFKLVGRNLANLRDTHKLIVVLLSLGTEFARLNRDYVRDAIFTSTVNWLASVSMFLDHTKYDIEKYFGKDSNEAQNFHNVRRGCFETNAGFRFAYKLRNYVLHVGLPTLHIDVRRPAHVGSSSALNQVARLYLDRESLLQTWSNWGVVKRDLQALPERFELMPLARSAMEAVIDIHTAVFDAYLSNAVAKSGSLRRALARIDEQDGGPLDQACVLRYSIDDAGRVRDLTPTYIPVAIVEALGQVADGLAPYDSLKSLSEPPSRPKFDPDTIESRIHRDNRGAQVLSTWLAREDDSETLDHAVSRIIQEDGGIEPLISGLLNVSGVLAHMTAMVLGTEASGLIAGFLDVYPLYDERESDEAPLSD